MQDASHQGKAASLAASKTCALTLPCPQCDEARPTCNQCAKSRRICPGYKDEFDLVFRNETQATERRARKANKKALEQKYGKDYESGETSASSTSPASSTDTCLIPASPQLPVEDQAACHFVSNFVLVPPQGSVRGYMDFLIPLVKMNNIPQHFRYAFDACALASLNNRVGTGNDFEKEALGKYTKALSATFAALRDPDVAKQDATLASVLLLGLFENITARQLGMLAWGSHIEGAVQLAKARGRKQLRTKVGLAMFIAVRTQMVRRDPLSVHVACTSLTGRADHPQPQHLQEPRHGCRLVDERHGPR